MVFYLRIGSYNITSSPLTNDLKSIIKNFDFDILLLQEASEVKSLTEFICLFIMAHLFYFICSC